ncbi:MAG: succinate dehydrogenase [bacterium]|nr:succinate dehydrogenase [bacterium]
MIDRPKPSKGFELYAWYFMRISGLVLIWLVLGHYLIMHVINRVEDINYQFVLNRMRIFVWRFWDGAMLILALLHGLNGIRILIEDYLKGTIKKIAHIVNYIILTVFLTLGLIFIFGFKV